MPESFRITAEALATVGLTVESERAQTFVRELEAAADRIRARGDERENDEGNFAWTVAVDAVREDRPLAELVAIAEALGIAERPSLDEFFQKSIRDMVEETIEDYLIDVIRISAGQEPMHRWDEVTR